jgi:cytoskeletal protein RodZ
MDVIDLSFIVLLIITLLSTTKSTFLVWGIILILGYIVLKFLFFREYMANPSSTRLDQVNADIAYLKSIGLTETSDNETMKARVAERARLEQTATPPVSTPLRDQPATPPAPQLPPVPAMKCSIENFGSI